MMLSVFKKTTVLFTGFALALPLAIPLQATAADPVADMFVFGEQLQIIDSIQSIEDKVEGYLKTIQENRERHRRFGVIWPSKAENDRLMAEVSSEAENLGMEIEPLKERFNTVYDRTTRRNGQKPIAGPLFGSSAREKEKGLRQQFASSYDHILEMRSRLALESELKTESFPNDWVLGDELKEVVKAKDASPVRNLIIASLKGVGPKAKDAEKQPLPSKETMEKHLAALRKLKEDGMVVVESSALCGKVDQKECKTGVMSVQEYEDNYGKPDAKSKVGHSSNPSSCTSNVSEGVRDVAMDCSLAQAVDYLEKDYAYDEDAKVWSAKPIAAEDREALAALAQQIAVQAPSPELITRPDVSVATSAGSSSVAESSDESISLRHYGPTRYMSIAEALDYQMCQDEVEERECSLPPTAPKGSSSGSAK